ncbi:MAG: hypothetical protein ACYST6_12945 [Planctomycetota bacterium]|jgi:hypothetical protein
MPKLDLTTDEAKALLDIVNAFDNYLDDETTTDVLEPYIEIEYDEDGEEDDFDYPVINSTIKKVRAL